MTKRTPKPWTPEEINLLNEVRSTMSVKSIATQLNRSYSSIKMMIYRLNTLSLDEVKKSCEAYSKPWTYQEILDLEKYYPNGSREEIMDKLPTRKWETITNKAARLKIRRSPELVKSMLITAAKLGGQVTSNKTKLKTDGRTPQIHTYGQLVNGARVFLAEHRPRGLDKREARKSERNYVSGSTLVGF